MIPCFLGDQEPALVRLDPEEIIPSRDIWLLTHKDLRKTARVRVFMDFMADAIRAHAKLLEGKLPNTLRNIHEAR